MNIIFMSFRKSVKIENLTRSDFRNVRIVENLAINDTVNVLKIVAFLNKNLFIYLLMFKKSIKNFIPGWLPYKCLLFFYLFICYLHFYGMFTINLDRFCSGKRITAALRNQQICFTTIGHQRRDLKHIFDHSYPVHEVFRHMYIFYSNSVIQNF